MCLSSDNVHVCVQVGWVVGCFAEFGWWMKLVTYCFELRSVTNMYIYYYIYIGDDMQLCMQLDECNSEVETLGTLSPPTVWWHDSKREAIAPRGSP